MAAEKQTTIPTPTVTPTPVPNSTVLRFQSIKLHGIGSGGDNTNPNLPGNSNPLRTTRTLTIELINSSGTSLPASTGNITFRPTTGDFGGDIVLDSSIPAGSYLIKIKSPQYLKKQLAGIISIATGAINQFPANKDPGVKIAC